MNEQAASAAAAAAAVAAAAAGAKGGAGRGASGSNLCQSNYSLKSREEGGSGLILAAKIRRRVAIFVRKCKSRRRQNANQANDDGRGAARNAGPPPAPPTRPTDRIIERPMQWPGVISPLINSTAGGVWGQRQMTIMAAAT